MNVVYIVEWTYIEEQRRLTRIELLYSLYSYDIDVVSCIITACNHILTNNWIFTPANHDEYIRNYRESGNSS